MAFEGSKERIGTLGGREIGARRLEALSFAVLCSGCQSRREATQPEQRGHSLGYDSRLDLSTGPPNRIRSLHLRQGSHPRSSRPEWNVGP